MYIRLKKSQGFSLEIAVVVDIASIKILLENDAVKFDVIWHCNNVRILKKKENNNEMTQIIFTSSPFFFPVLTIIYNKFCFLEKICKNILRLQNELQNKYFFLFNCPLYGGV